MTLNIPAVKGIEILKKRKGEIYNSSFEPNVWVGKTENDLVEIFGILDQKNHNNFGIEQNLTIIKIKIGCYKNL